MYYMANPVLGKFLCSDWFFLGQDFAVRTVSMEMVQSEYFCFGAKPPNSKFATKTAKKCENCHSSHWNYQQKLKRLKFFRNFKDGWRRRTFFKCKPPEVHLTIRNGVPYNIPQYGPCTQLVLTLKHCWKTCYAFHLYHDQDWNFMIINLVGMSPFTSMSKTNQN